ncbi:antitoxin VapB family protein [Halococcus agarilyticus]|uniref:antitoxin VapB family protein n=1 Tax=Halococcus agarilyticus TaxID=1232219 RepID=UPI000677626E|nr:antitoxin VapB family protein [Halococcus agarilyticus]
MGIADEQIRVSSGVKRELERQKRAGESYNEVLERMLAEQPAASFEDGFGRWSDEEAARVREGRRQTREKRKRRMRRER